MIYLITGANGAGKSLYAVSLIAKILEENNKPGALPYDEWIQQYDEDDNGYLEPIVEDPKPLIRNVFTNIPGLSFDSEYIYTLPEGLHDLEDEKQFPFGSVIFDDEAHRRIPATGKAGAHPDDRINNLDMHRHRGLDIYYITQYPSKLHHVVRNLVSRHYHLQNAMGAGAATLFTYQHAELNVNDYGARQGADKEIFRYPKSLFKHYKSSSLHTKRLRIPKQVYFIGGLFVVLISLFIYFALSSFSSDVAANDTVLPPPATAAAGVVGTGKPATAPAATPSRSFIIGGCISKGATCQCYDSDLYPLDLELSECLNYLESPLPTRPIIASSSSGRNQPSGD